MRTLIDRWLLLFDDSLEFFDDMTGGSQTTSRRNPVVLTVVVFKRGSFRAIGEAKGADISPKR